MAEPLLDDYFVMQANDVLRNAQPGGLNHRFQQQMPSLTDPAFPSLDSALWVGEEQLMKGSGKNAVS